MIAGAVACQGLTDVHGEGPCRLWRRAMRLRENSSWARGRKRERAGGRAACVGIGRPGLATAGPRLSSWWPAKQSNMGLKFGLEMGLCLAHQKNEIKYEKCT